VLSRFALSVAGVLLLGLTILRVVECWSTDSHLEHVAGVWVAEAIDLTRGVFYRAPYGSYGYGGTRYFPLFFCVHAAAIKLFGTWRAPGYALSAVSVVLFLVAVYYLSRRIGAARWLGIAACLAVLAGTSAQEALLTIREDAMATMLNIWGVAICAGEFIGLRRVYCAAALFTLAFAMLFICTLVVTVVIFSSDGIEGNHLIDLQVASTILVVDWALQAGTPDFAIAASAAACLIAWLALIVSHGSTDTVPVRAQLKDVIHVIGRTDQTILSENPLVPIVAGQQPYLIDPFCFRLMLEKRPSLGEEPGHLIFHLSRTGVWTHLELDSCDRETVLPGTCFFKLPKPTVRCRGCLEGGHMHKTELRSPV